MQSRGFAVPDCPPLIKTPEPREVPGARFDPAKVDKVIAAFRQLRHTKGRFAGQRFEPESWQVAYMIAPVFGWVHRSVDSGNWVRIITQAYFDMPRKNGKTTTVSGFGIYLTAPTVSTAPRCSPRRRPRIRPGSCSSRSGSW